jgi:hypothetical protein
VTVDTGACGIWVGMATSAAGRAAAKTKGADGIPWFGMGPPPNLGRRKGGAAGTAPETGVASERALSATGNAGAARSGPSGKYPR